MKTLTKNLIKLSKTYNLNFFIIAYVEDKGSNLNTLIIALNTFVNCEHFRFGKVIKTFIFGMHFPRLVNMLQ
jgi:hypothetical protein